MYRLLVLLLLAAPPLFSWGLKGHRIVARLAETRLGERAQKAVRELLGDDTLTAIANEADAYRSDSKWKCAAPFHYVSIDDGESYTSSEKNARGDMLQALVYFEDALRDSKQPAAARVLALKWLVHLIGDLHQPLHVGRSCDRGGNSTAVYWFGVKSNLHKVWDAQLINPEELSFSEYAAQLDKVAPQTAAAWSRGTYAAWAAEAPALRTQIYTCLAKDGCCAQKACKVTETVFATCSDDSPDLAARLEYAYVEKNRALLHAQLTRAGVRLAAVLNRIFEGVPLTEAERSERRVIGTEPIEKCVGKSLE